MNPTQTRILQYLKTHPATTAAAISQALGMTTANIRHHLAPLKKDLLIERAAASLKKGRGRPVYLYSLGPQAQQHHLDALADILLSIWIDEADPAAVLTQAGLLADRLIQNERRLAALAVKPGPLTQTLSQLAQALDGGHYQARWEAHPGSPHFILGQCPYRAIVDRHPVLCQMDARLLEKLLRRPVKQIAKIGQGAHPAPNCIFEIDLQRLPAE